MEDFLVEILLLLSALIYIGILVIFVNICNFD